MRVPCPRGAQCPGSTSFVIQECFLAHTSRRLPRRVLGGHMLGAIGEGVKTFAESLLSIRYDIYQCPACGEEVVFMRSEGSDGCRRIWDSLDKE